MANSLTFNSTDLGTLGVTITKTSFPSMSKPVTDIQQSAYGRAGSYNQRFSSREFKIPVIIQGTDQSGLYSNLDAIAALLNQDSEKPLGFDYYNPDRYWNARYMGGLENVKTLNDSAVETELNFIAPDPYAYSNDSTTLSSITITGTSFTYPTPQAIPGNAINYPTITITATNGANGVFIKSANVSGNFAYSAILSSGNLLRINSTDFLCEKSTNGGSSWTNVMSYVTGTFPKLIGGTVNTLTVYGVANGGSMSIAIRGRYL